MKTLRANFTDLQKYYSKWEAEERKRREMSQLKVKLPQKALPMRRSSGELWIRARIPEMKNSEIIKPAALDSFR